MRSLLLLLLTSFSLDIQAQSAVLPAPKEIVNFDEELMINNKIGVDTKFYKPWMGYISSMLPEFSLEPYYPDSTNQTRFTAKLSNELDSSTYKLRFNKNGFELIAGSESAQFNGVMTLIQILNTTKGSIRSFEIVDYPDFDWRGIHLDVSRHFFHVDEITHILDLMALYKLNKFHWHLTDDQGWRIQIDKYPLLTEVGAFRDRTLIGHYSDTPQKYDTTTYGGFYTKKDIRAVVEYAKRLNIEVVPEIELPGHSRAALAAYPELSCTGQKKGVPGTWGVFEDIYCSKESSIQFLQNVLAEVIELFSGEYVHIGGDEAPKSRWKKCDECQKVISSNNLKDEHELQSYFIGQMDEFLTKRGKTLIGWDEILEGGLSPNATVMSWRGENGGIEAAKQGHCAVMTPTTYCYFDYYQSTSENEPTAIGGYLPLEKVYKFNVIPKELKGSEASKYVLGGQANLWSEYILDLQHLEYMMFPRAIALAQSVWSSDKPAYSEFLDTYINYHEDLLSALGVNYARSIHAPNMNIVRSERGIGVHFAGRRLQYEWWAGHE
jgi:hexosaminidase